MPFCRDTRERQLVPFTEKIRTARDRVRKESVDPWRARLEKLRGRLGDDKVERIATQAIFDYLDLPQGMRTAQASRRLAKMMSELCWTPIRARGLNRSGYRDQVRGWARDRSGESLL
jgi:hypothetical protein